MILGPDEILICPACRAFTRRTTLISGNTCGRRRFTDGLVDTPMLPRPPQIVKCPACADCFWMSDAQVVGRVDDGRGARDAKAPPEWREAKRVLLPDEQDYYDALRSGLAGSAGEERDARIEAWWRSNDPVRMPVSRRTATAAAPGERETNLRALLELLDDSDPNGQVMKAEVLRELARFDEAEAVLDRVADPQLRDAVACIRALCRAKDPVLREL